MNAEISQPNFPWSILSRGMSLTLIAPSNEKHMPSPKTQSTATTFSMASFLFFSAFSSFAFRVQVTTSIP
jgi:hypothetical protein